jgi:hypothetical protein
MTGLTTETRDTPFVVRLDAFAGPLDLLLHLIREQEIDITDIPIASIADQFLQAIHGLGLNEAADYLEMAAHLLRIKIQMLMPRPFDEDAWEDPRAELVRRAGGPAPAANPPPRGPVRTPGAGAPTPPADLPTRPRRMAEA